MIPFGNETVTLYSQVTTTDESGRHHVSYIRTLLHGCSWRRKTQAVRYDDALAYTETVTVRVPVCEKRPLAGDLMVFGDYKGTVTSSADFRRVIEEMRSAGGAFTVSVASDNSSAPLPHYKAEGMIG